VGKEVLEDASAECLKGGVRWRGDGGGEKSERVGGRIVHRACTGNAERELRDSAEYLRFSPDGITCTGREDFSSEHFTLGREAGRNAEESDSSKRRENGEIFAIGNADRRTQILRWRDE
jgi:hypothetical protein